MCEGEGEREGTERMRLKGSERMRGGKEGEGVGKMVVWSWIGDNDSESHV